jgi:hypothetical protein
MIKAFALFTSGVLAAVPDNCFSELGPYGGSTGLTKFTNAASLSTDFKSTMMAAALVSCTTTETVNGSSVKKITGLQLKLVDTATKNVSSLDAMGTSAKTTCITLDLDPGEYITSIQQ